MKRFLLLFCALLSIAPASSSIKKAIDRGYNKNVIEVGSYNGFTVYAITRGTVVSTYDYNYYEVFINGILYKGEFYQFNLSSCIRQQNSLTAQFVSFSLSNLANIFYPPNFYNN